MSVDGSGRALPQPHHRANPYIFLLYPVPVNEVLETEVCEEGSPGTQGRMLPNMSDVHMSLMALHYSSDNDLISNSIVLIMSEA